MRELVCLDMPLGSAFVDRLQRAWDDGDAIFPLDQRLPASARDRVLRAVRPTVISDASGDRRLDGEPVETDDAVVVATSGTTGDPKAAILTHSAVAASAQATSQRLGVTSSDCWFACLPPAHVGGLSVVTRALLTQTRLITTDRFTPEAYNDAADNGATLVSLVATALARVDASRYRTIVLGGARPPSDRPANCVTTYGLTESGSGVVYDGRPLDGVEIDIRDGVVHLRAPMMCRGYRDGTVPFDRDGWFRTGDLGAFDNGVLQVFGREGDLIVTGGENVWPEDVEAAISSMPHVRDVCVAGVADPEWGSAVHAWIVSDTTLTLEQVRDHVKRTHPAWCAPRAIHQVAEIPRTALGKPQRHLLVATV